MRIERDQARTLIVLAGLTVIFVAGFWLPHLAKMRRLATQIRHAKAQLNADQNNTTAIVALAQDVVELRRIVASSHRLVPREADLASLLKQLSTDLAQTVGTGTGRGALKQETQTRPVERYANYSRIPLSIRFEGDFPSTFAFLQRVEATPRLVRIDELEITSDPRERDRQPEVRLQLSAFFTPQGSDADQTVRQP